jgi:hypothetical protein
MALDPRSRLRYTSDVWSVWVKGISVQLVRLGEPGSERPFVRADDGTTYELGGLTADIDGGFLAADGVARVAAALAAG